MSSEIFRKSVVVTTSGVFADQPLLCTLSGLGDDSVLYSIDHPFEIMDQGAHWFDKAPISEETRQKDIGATQHESESYSLSMSPSQDLLSSSTYSVLSVDNV